MISAALRDFDRLWSGPGEPDLLQAALHVARIGDPDLDCAAQAARVARLGELAQARLSGAPNEHSGLLRFNHLFFDELGFSGETLDYYHPRNSFLPTVLDRRCGIPISLSVLYMVIGAQAGLRLSGIGLPAHFVVRHDCADPAQRVYIDPYNRQVLPNREACRRLITRISGHEVTLDEEAFAPLDTRAIVVRMLANLKGSYLRLGDLAQAVAVLDRILLLLPEDGHQWRDRGLLHFQLDHLHQASRDLARSIWLAENEEQRQQEVVGLLQRIQEALLRLN